VKLQSGVGNYRGRRAVRLVNDDGPVGTVSGRQVLAIVNASDFEDGTIEAEIVGFPRQGAKPSTRGFYRRCVPRARSWIVGFPQKWSLLTIHSCGSETKLKICGLCSYSLGKRVCQESHDT
jgi:hypothetical protein